ncbi:UV radiation resistance protein and autophagy-related subunit 14-domain-containing protein [Lentinula edodes]|uniref:UV radiation resistance protein and autophagy-related subunit 14-domain-containing protein n=1 Tax=Lentinula edodes TaxID=5353 RepID=UPI001E8D2E39|nr:UV radiation resistance protein and autophagy-related subunit 14-domain-containing protein [Lentinula edodes]KAH7881283.1 UV radiation resistance protein and autophagy-related subunit 14-domain-containing protein [Lentinula edodes]
MNFSTDGVTVMSSENPVPFQSSFDFNHLFQRRIGHITSIQIRNLTPFPARDTFTSALIKPIEISTATHGYVADDLDATLTRKRTRRVSTNSITTLRSSRSEDGESAGVGEGHEEGKRTTSRLSEKSTTIGRTAPTLRPQRNRTTSLASVFPESTEVSQGSFSLNSNVEAYKHHATLEDHSQTGLEKIIGSRLVETFLAVTAISEPSYVDAGLPTTSSSSFFPTSTPSSPRNGFPLISPRKDVFTPSSPSPLPNTEKSRRDSRASTLSSSSSGHSKTMYDATLSRKGAVKPATGSPIASTSTFPSSPELPSSPVQPSVPAYFSPIHQPSTNPSFFFDPTSEFASWTDFSAVKLKVELWAKIGNDSGPVNGKGKEKERPRETRDSNPPEWQVLEEWNVDLNELIPLPNINADDDPHHQLPSNTLLITLNPPGQTFYAYVPILSQPSHRTMDLASGYSSDPESTIRKNKEIDTKLDFAALPSRRRRQRGRQGQETAKEEYIARTAGWKDLFKLVTIWTTIKDNEKSLEDIVRGLDRLIADDQLSPLKREISERECRIAELRADCASVSTQSQELRDEILIRREQLRERRNMLANVEQQDEDEQQEWEEIEEDLLDERARLASLRSLTIPSRTGLLSTLSYLFPIELRSPPDLLFTILDVPLPIPASPNDPAPPLTLPAHIDVNEETVATALGYVAIVVQLLAAYLGHVLVYPITYIGSRSLIRDGISAMVGPRMFPLFSKGVDTYRFEYGVFLLNKDIEMLMVEHDLRAIDIRHTLPNLKNLLLTLTDGEDVPIRPAIRVASPVSSLSGLESPKPQSLASSQEIANSNTTTPKATCVDLPPEITPPASGSSTPTTPSAPTSVSMDTLKKTSRFLGGFTPFSGFLRARAPSSLLFRNVDESAGSFDTDELPISSSNAAENTESAEHNATASKRDEVINSEPGEVGSPVLALGKVKVADRFGETTEVDTDADSQPILVKGRLASVWKVQ